MAGRGAHLSLYAAAAAAGWAYLYAAYPPCAARGDKAVREGRLGHSPPSWGSTASPFLPCPRPHFPAALSVSADLSALSSRVDAGVVSPWPTPAQLLPPDRALLRLGCPCQRNPGTPGSSPSHCLEQRGCGAANGPFPSPCTCFAGCVKWRDTDTPWAATAGTYVDLGSVESVLIHDPAKQPEAKPVSPRASAEPAGMGRATATGLLLPGAALGWGRVTGPGEGQSRDSRTGSG